MKSNYFLINCFLLTSSLFCMDDSPLVRCPQNRERHHHDCVITTHRSSDWNCFGCVTDKISLQANKIWLMTLFLSNVNSRGIPTGDPGLLRVIHCIERFRIATTKNIQQMQVFALEPAAASYIKRCEQFIADIADAEKKCGKQLMEIIAWLKRIPKAQDVNDCRQLEKKFNETLAVAIRYFYDYFSELNHIARCHYLHVLKIAGNDRTLFVSLSKKNDEYTSFFREYVAASAEPDRTYFDRVSKIIGAIFDFNRLQESHHIIFTHLVCRICYEKGKKIDKIFPAITRSRKLISQIIGEFKCVLDKGMLRQKVADVDLLPTLENNIQIYENSLMKMRKLIYPPTSSYRMPTIPTPNISKARPNVPLLKLSKLPLPAYEQFQNLPPLSS